MPTKIIERLRTSAWTPHIFTRGSSPVLILNCNNIAVAVTSGNETHQEGSVVRNIHVMLLAKVWKSTLEQWQSVLDFSAGVSPFCFPRQNVCEQVPIFVRSCFGKNVCVDDLMRHDEAQTSRKGVGVVMSDTVELVVFHTRKSSQKKNRSKVPVCGR